MTDRLATILAALGDRWPVVTGPGWAVVNGDCLDVMAAMPGKCVAHVLTDPPYESEAHTKARRQRSSGVVGVHEIPFSAITSANRDAAACQVARLSCGWCLAFCQVEAVACWRNSFVSASAKWVRAMAWVKPDGCPQFTGDRPAQGYECMALAWSGSGRMRWNAGGKRGVYTHHVGAHGGLSNPHPTTKPVGLMLEILADFTNPDDLILDAFAGSATTGIACLRLGRQFIGIERDPAYFEIACRRMRGDEAKPRPEQPSIFDLIPAATARAKETP